MFKRVNSNIDFPSLERDILDLWYKNGIVTRYLNRNKNRKKRFSFLDGPITANNPMGIHHAWGRTYKDLWQRFYALRGYNQRFQNGFDCQGLWVEVEVEKELGITNKKQIEELIPGDREASIAKFVELCKKRVRKYSKIQTEQSKRLGYFMDWDHSYYTMSDHNNFMIWHFLKTCHKRGWIYKGRDSVPWCPRCETAISQHEMLTEDYKEIKHKTVFVKFPIVTKGWEKTSFLIWTTTPWTIPANVAVAVNTEYTYSVWKNSETKEKIIFINVDENGKIALTKIQGQETSIQKFIFQNVTTNNTQYKKVKDVLGKKLLGLYYKAPFDHLPRVKKAKQENPEKFHIVVDGSDIVISTEGTGILHLAPGAGQEDFRLGQKEDLPVISVIADDASYLGDMNEFSGKNAKKDPAVVIDYLKTKENGRYLLKTQNYTHRYPSCWRCKEELVWKVTEEWYIAMDKKDKTDKQKRTLRKQMKDVAKTIRWFPSFGLNRELDWLGNMHDWLISKKNRYWGLALPIYECKNCNTFDVIGSKEELQKKAISGWDRLKGHSPHKPFIDAVKIVCPKCKSRMSRIEPVGNPWLDAGIVPFSTIAENNQGEPLYRKDKLKWKKWFPPDFITESFPGQFKNWFYSMIAMSTVLKRTRPYKTVLGFGTLLGEDGRPMHKSWENAIEFNEGADKIGVDVMRWMYVTHNPEDNLLFGYKRADETRRRFHLILWNIYNFFVTYANVDGFNPKSKIKSPHLNILDRWIQSRLNNTIKIVTDNLTSYDAFHASHAIEDLIGDISRWYIRRSRNRVGPTIESRIDKTSFYITTYKLLVTISQLLAPFTPFIAEEIYRNLTGKDSVHLSNWPDSDPKKLDENLEKQMSIARVLVEAGHSIRREKKIKIRQPLKYAFYEEKSNTLNNSEILKLILDELNIHQWITEKDAKSFIRKSKIIKKEINGSMLYIDTRITTDLKEEGEARELIRKIQILRKKERFLLDETILIKASKWPEKYEDLIKQKTLAKEISWGKDLRILKD